MTLSGGEPLVQIDFAEALLARREGGGPALLHGDLRVRAVRALRAGLPPSDLFLYDIKDTDDARHRDGTGVSNETILENLRALHDAGAGCASGFRLCRGATTGTIISARSRASRPICRA